MENINNIKIRMYRHGFGDCFLLRFFHDTNLVFKMLIDCGLKNNDKVIGVEIAKVVKDIEKETRITTAANPHLDLLVVTHEHWDHVSAFKPENKLFDNFEVDNIWMAWTEDPKDKIAQQINSQLKENVTALGIAVQKLKNSLKGSINNNAIFKGKEVFGIRENFNQTLNDLLQFYGPFSATIDTPSGIKIKDKYDISAETQKAFNHIKTKIAKDISVIKYLKPGTFENIGKLPGIRIYVLGPPQNEKINKDSPSKGVSKEVYFGLNNETTKGFVKGVLKSAKNTDMKIDDFDNGNPFKNVAEVIGNDTSLNTFYNSTYNNPTENWRKIDDDWLDMAGNLALQMENDTNNTSLVLAIEIIATGKFLLFPGDAQVGNWESWHDYKWKVEKNGFQKEITATDILNNTIFYKAGHHASHNATLEEKGLELMNDENLVVFVPEKNDQYNGIPYPKLVERLNEKAKGRVLFSADVNFKPEDMINIKPQGISTEDWKNFKDSIVIDKKYIEYTIKV
jgi:hypothetical protein